MPEDPKSLLRNAGGVSYVIREWVTKTQRYRDAQFVLENLRKHRVFYPGAWIDWEPLLDLTHLCDTFIFCDWNVTEESVTGDFGLAGVTTDFIIPLRKEDVAYLADLGTLPRSVRQGVQALVGEPVDEPWGKYAQLTRTVGNEIRKLHFFYLGMEGITAYFNLFAPHKMAPRVLCMKFGMDPNGKQFWDWDGGLLGYIIRGVGAFPEQPVDFRGPGWDRWIAQDCRPEPVQAGARRVIVKRGALTPGAVTSCDAILLPDSLYKMHRRLWLKRARIILLTLSERLRARSERVISSATFGRWGLSWIPLFKLARIVASNASQASSSAPRVRDRSWPNGVSNLDYPWS